jgi:hypothetical protein
MVGSPKRARLPLLAAAALVALAVGVSQALAHQRTTERFQSLKSTCDSTKGSVTVGSVNFAYKSDKKVLTMKIHMEGALPNTTYTFYLLDADTCTPIGGALGTVLTKANGKSHTKLKASVVGHKRFVLDADDGTNGNYTPIADFS